GDSPGPDPELPGGAADLACAVRPPPGAANRPLGRAHLRNPGPGCLSSSADPLSHLDVFDADCGDADGAAIEPARGEVGGRELLGADVRQRLGVVAVCLVAGDEESVLIVHELGRVEERPLRAEARREHIVVVLCRTEAAAVVLVESGEAAANGDAEIPSHDGASSARVAWSNSAMISCASIPGWVGTAASRTERRDRAIVVGSKLRICPLRCPSSNRATRSPT